VGIRNIHARYPTRNCMRMGGYSPVVATASLASALLEGFEESCSIRVERMPASEAAPSLSVQVIEMRKPTFSKILFAFFAFVALACAPKPAFAQHGGGGHGGGSGGGFHGGGGGFH